MNQSSESKPKEQLVTFEQNEGGNQLEEISYRLTQILRKFLNPGENIEKYKKPTVENIKEMIFEISSKCDEQNMRFKQLENQRSHSNDSTSTPLRVNRFFAGGGDDVSNYASTTDISLILDEREKRL